MKPLAIVILAAGASSRMGTPKQLLPFQTDTLLGTVIKNATHTRIETIYCVVGANSSEIKKSHQQYAITFITNSDFKAGLSSSIQSAVQFIAENKPDIEAILVLLGDQPFVSSEYMQLYIDLHLKHPEQRIATAYKNNTGVPAVFPKKYFGRLQKLEGDRGAKELLNTIPDTFVVKLPMEALTDIDTHKEYLTSLKRDSL